MTKKIIKKYRGPKGMTSGKAETSDKIDGDLELEDDRNLEKDSEGSSKDSSEESQGGEGEEQKEENGEGGQKESPIYAQVEVEGEGQGGGEEESPKKIAFEALGTLMIKGTKGTWVPNYGMIRVLLEFVLNGNLIYIWSDKGTKKAEEIKDILGICDHNIQVIPKKLGEDIDLSFDPKDINLAKMNIITH